MKQLFSYSFPNATNKDTNDISDILNACSEIDRQIEASAPEWPVGKIAKIDVAILRLAIYEMIIEKKEPSKVIIDEAIELAKEFGNSNSPQFINGVLGTVYKKL